MKSEHIKYLVCPICKKKFAFAGPQINGKIKDGFLVCPNSHSFRIINSIPRLVTEIKDNKAQTIRAFSEKWQDNKDYMEKMSKFQKKWYLKRYGFTRKSFKKFLSTKKFILEAGCGVGKDTGFFAKNTKGIVFAIDISSSIDTAKQNNTDNNICFIQADITQLPFKKGFFDFISCDQVIHHTPMPMETLRHLKSRTAKDGTLAIYIYKQKSAIREFCDDFIRQKGKRLSYKECYEFCKPITLLGKELSKIKQKINVPDIPVLGIKKGKYDLQRFVYYNIMKCFWNDGFDFKINNVINVDWYNPEIASRHTLEEIQLWCNLLNLKIIHLDDKEQSGISFIVKK